MAITENYAASFARRSGPAEPRWLDQRRRHAIDDFSARGFPTRREEAWRFSDLSPLTQQIFPPALGGVASPSLRALADSHRLPGTTSLVLINGRVAADLSDALPAGVATLAAAPDHASFAESDRSGPAALNAAFSADGLVLRLDSGTSLAQPLHLIQITDAAETASFHTRHLVELGQDARALLIETHLAPKGNAQWSNAVTLIRLAKGAVLEHAKLIAGADDLIHLAEQSVEIGEHARYDGFFLTVGGHLSRQDIFTRLGGVKAECAIGGVALLRGAQEATLATTVLHASPGGTTREIFKSVLDDRSHAVFQGCIRVAPDAQKTNANQLSQTLLLSDGAHVDAKPELEILADDVKCSHGTTVGALDDDQFFYLVSRGIPEPEARSMLIAAFASSALDTVANAELRSYLARHVEAWLGDLR
jgi:Fe-S cluster assembly protein SufD